MTRALGLAATVCLMLMTACVSSETGRRSSGTADDASVTNYQLGAQYYRNGSFELARSRLERAVELDPKNADAYSLLALTLVQLGNNRLATEAFNRSVRLEPDNKNNRNSYAVYLCQQGNYDEALEQFDRAIRVRENDNAWVEMTNAGVCVAKKPDLERAERYLRDALERKPTYSEALIQLSALKHRTGENLEARAFMQRYLAISPASSAVLYLAVQIETQLGADRAATDYMNQLLRDFPESAEAKLMLQRDR